MNRPASSRPQTSRRAVPAAAVAAASKPRPQTVIKTKAGFFTKAFLWLLLLALGALVGGAYLLKGSDGVPLARTFIKQGRILLKMDPPPPPPPKLTDDPKYKEAAVAREVAAEAGLIEKQIEETAKAAGTLAGLAPKYPGQSAAAEIAKLAEFQRDASAKLAELKVAAEKERAAKEAAEAEAAKPKIVPYELRKVHPWGKAAKGQWVRWKKSAAGATIYEDEIVLRIDDDGVRLGGFVSVNGQVSPLPEREILFGRGTVAREEKLGDVACLVVESAGTFRWIPKEGRAAERLAIRTASGDSSVALALGEEELGGKKCLRVEANGFLAWGHDEAAGFWVRVQGENYLAEAVESGSDPSARPEFPKPAKPVEAAVEVPAELKALHPWTAFKPGAWARRRAEFQSPTGSGLTAGDTTLVESGPEGVVLRLEMLGFDGLPAAFDRKSPFAPAGTRIAGEETLRIGESEFACAIVEAGGAKTWVLKGPVPALLRFESPHSTRHAIAIAERAMRIGASEVKCLRVVLTGKTDDQAVQEEVLYSAEVPGIEAARETLTKTPVGESRVSSTVTEFGDDASKKSAIGFVREDPAKLEERRARKALESGERDVVEASGLFRELADASRQLPADPAALKALLGKAEQAGLLFKSARESYVSARAGAPDPLAVEDRLSKIEKAEALLAKYREAIQAKLK